MGMVQDPLDLLIVLILLLELVSIGKFLFLSRQQWFDLIRCIGLPNAQISVLRA